MEKLKFLSKYCYYINCFKRADIEEIDNLFCDAKRSAKILKE